MKIAVLMTCYNRAETTLECLQCLFAAASKVPYEFDVWLNDDASTDGTARKVRTAFPMVKIILGSGKDFWCGGMRRAWHAAMESGIDYRGYLWLNDDTRLHQDGLSVLLGHSSMDDSILVGAICSARDGRPTFGGEDEYGVVFPNGKWQSIRQMNGNVVWVPQSVFAKIGMLDRHWTHAMGDVDYSRTAVENGIGVFLTPSFVGRCEKDGGRRPWRNPDVPLLKRIRNLYSPLGYSEPYNLFRYCLKHDGLMVAIRNYLVCHIRMLIPRLFA